MSYSPPPMALFKYWLWPSRAFSIADAPAPPPTDDSRPSPRFVSTERSKRVCTERSERVYTERSERAERGVSAGPQRSERVYTERSERASRPKSGNHTVDREGLRERLRDMTDAELRRFAQAAHQLCSASAHLGESAWNRFAIHIEECQAEWRKRHSHL